MDKNEIFKLAVIDYDNSFADLTKTTFSIIEKIIRGINLSELSEEEKKDKLGKILSKINGSNEFKIMGVKREELTIIIDRIFGLRNNKVSNEYLQELDMNEILYYFCSISRMAKSKAEFSHDEIEKTRNEVAEIMDKMREENVVKEKKKEEEEVKKQKEEADAKAKKEEEEKKRLALMSKFEIELENLEKVKNDPSKNDDEKENAYTEFYQHLDEFDVDKVKAAQILKELWNSIGKWEGKLTKKQQKKVKKVKGILSEK